MYNVLSILSSGNDWDNRVTGDGMSVIFYDADTEFYPGGIGSSLGYSNYVGPVAYNADNITAIDANSGTHINGVKRAYVGIGFDVRGAFSTTLDGKLGSSLSGISQYANTSYVAVSGAGEGYNTDTTLHPNTIGVRLGSRDYYRLHSKSLNLTDYPVASAEKYSSSPSVNLHQSVASKDDLVYTTARVTLQNKGQRVVVELKDNSTGNFYTYHVADLNNGGLGSGSNPTNLKTAIAFSTSDAFMNCDIKNVSLYGHIVDNPKSDIAPLSGVNFRVIYPEGVTEFDQSGEPI